MLYSDHSQQIVALDSRTGAVRWQVPGGTSGHVVASADAAIVMPDAVAGPTISVAAHSLDTGAQLWSTRLSDIASAFSDPRGFLLVDDRANTITLVHADSGAPIWRAQLDKIDQVDQAPVIVPSTGHVTLAEANSIAFVDRSTGQLEQVAAQTNGGAATAAAGDHLYVSLAAKLVAMTAAGTSWSAALPHLAQSPPAPLADGGVAVQSEDPLCGSAS